MVLSQLRPSGVRDERVIAAMAAVPREAFVAPYQQAIAYVDEDLPLGAGRYLMEPLVFGRLLVAAEVGPDDVVLDVGCASGYSAAVLARLAGTVVALEEDEGLADRADSSLVALGVDNAAIMRRPLAGGYVEQGPYDVIVIEGAVPAIPDGIAEQLREGGRLVAVVGNADIGRCVVVKRIGGLLSERITHDAAIPPLPGFARRAEFVF